MPPPLNILVAPLDWGLGHASRCMPVIDFLLKKKVNVIIGTNGRAGKFLADAYPTLTHISLPAYNVRYSRGAVQIFTIARQIPRLLSVIRAEHKLLGQLQLQYRLDGIISDNRYGLWSEKIPSVFICHQLAIALPSSFDFLRKWLYWLHIKFIRRFDDCWIPDVKGKQALSGSLSQAYPLPKNFQHIGILSRFLEKGKISAEVERPDKVLMDCGASDLLAILSGPEPQRTLLEKKLVKATVNAGLENMYCTGKTRRVK